MTEDNSTAQKTRRYQPADTRQRIIAAARALFMDKGYAATSTADLAVAADVAEGSIFYHFGSKRALLEALGKIYAEDMVKAMMGDAADYDALDPGDMVARCFDYCMVAGTPEDMIGNDKHSSDGAEFQDAARDVVLGFVEKVMAPHFAKMGLDQKNLKIKAAMSYAAVHEAIMRAHGKSVSVAERDIIKAVAVDYIRAVAGYQP
jgi:AcrR family transcriptional regulator